MVLRGGLGKPDVTRIAGELTVLERAPLLVYVVLPSTLGYAVRCRVITVNDDDFPPRFSKAVVRMKRKAHS